MQKLQIASDTSEADKRRVVVESKVSFAYYVAKSRRQNLDSQSVEMTSTRTDLKETNIFVSFAKEDGEFEEENTIWVSKSNQTSTRCSYIGAEWRASKGYV